MRQLLADRSHVLLMSPKAHPEVAGKGIAYSSGKAKRDFRRLNDCVAKRLHADVLAAIEYVDIERVRCFAKKTREYMRGYARLHNLFGFGEDDKMERFFAVEKFVRECNTHSTLDQDSSSVDTA